MECDANSSEFAALQTVDPFRLLVEAVKDYAIFFLDPHGRIRTWNRGAERMTGYCAEEILGQHFSCLYPVAEVAQNLPLRDLQRALAQDGCELEGYRRRKDGLEFASRITLTPLRDPRGTHLGFSQVLRDLRERQQAEADRRSLKELTRSNSELEQFAYVASHDLQEPLRAVSGCAQLLRRRYKNQLDASAEELIEHIIQGAARMQTLINDLLTYSRISTRSKAFELVDCNQAVRQALTYLTELVQESQAKITLEDLPRVRADRTQLVQLFQNLISNALKFRRETPVEVHLSVQAEQEQWIFQVRDNGIGIEERFFERIFGIFQRLHTRTDFAGSGIGLALCKQIVERHGGRIWVESELGKGSTFFFSLPAKEGSDDERA